MDQESLKTAERDMNKIVAGFIEGLQTLRTGRASTALVEELSVNYYGAPTPLKHAATLTTPDPRLIVISPWDKSLLSEIESAIKISDLGLNPVNDGNVVRLAIPPMTEERRRELVKKLHQQAEETRVALRTVRRKVWDAIQDMEKEGQISEDDRYTAEKDLNKLIDESDSRLHQIVADKEREITTV